VAFFKPQRVGSGESRRLKKSTKIVSELPGWNRSNPGRNPNVEIGLR